ncbi:MAG: alanine racemase [Gammaproteobacteria bacterium]|nr:alanine racemase [Gammaproteobacteria bacterium]
MSNRSWATINLESLRHNLSIAQQRCPSSELLPVVKANGYGHGLERVAKAIWLSKIPIRGLAVATIDEARRLREVDSDQSIVLLPGFINRDELEECSSLKIEPVVHSLYQIALLEAREQPCQFPFVWLKITTGMNRLGFHEDIIVSASDALNALPSLENSELILMSHLAWGDVDDDDACSFTAEQLRRFADAIDVLDHKGKCSLGASTGILRYPDTHFDIVRPGVMLYGSSPFDHTSSKELGLRPVMTLRSRLIAINELKAGDAIGYGVTYICEKEMRVGVVSIGYGDGYPRSASTGTPVVLEARDRLFRTSLIGRVSMDMITIDLTDIDSAAVEDSVILWGDALPAEEVAAHAGTIAYELFCQVTERVNFVVSE